MKCYNCGKEVPIPKKGLSFWVSGDKIGWTYCTRECLESGYKKRLKEYKKK